MSQHREERIVLLDSDAVADIMLEKGFSLGDIAERYGSRQSNITQLLSREFCRPRTAHKLADALGVSVADIVRK